jgi:norsolorinic acid ketoreductase
MLSRGPFPVYFLNGKADKPSWVQTDMGNKGAHANGLAEAPTTIETSVDGIVSGIDAATREHTSGNFISFNGNSYPW